MIIIIGIKVTVEIKVGIEMTSYSQRLSKILSHEPLVLGTDVAHWYQPSTLFVSRRRLTMHLYVDGSNPSISIFLTTADHHLRL